MGAPSFMDKCKRAICPGPHYQGFHQRELRYLRWRDGARSTW